MDDWIERRILEPRAAELCARAVDIHEQCARMFRAAGREAAAERAERNAALARDRLTHASAVARMYVLSRRFRTFRRLEEVLEAALDGAMTLIHADLGNVQLVDRQTGALRIVTQRGFGDAFLSHFAVVDHAGSACGRAVQARAQAVVPDVAVDPDFEPHRAIADASGFRAVQSTPLVDHRGRLHGVLSTHFQHPHCPLDHELRLVEVYARLLADAIAFRVDDGRPAPRTSRSAHGPVTEKAQRVVAEAQAMVATTRELEDANRETRARLELMKERARRRRASRV